MTRALTSNSTSANRIIGGPKTSAAGRRPSTRWRQSSTGGQVCTATSRRLRLAPESLSKFDAAGARRRHVGSNLPQVRTSTAVRTKTVVKRPTTLDTSSIFIGTQRTRRKMSWSQCSRSGYTKGHQDPEHAGYLRCTCARLVKLRLYVDMGLEGAAFRIFWLLLRHVRYPRR